MKSSRSDSGTASTNSASWAKDKLIPKIEFSGRGLGIKGDRSRQSAMRPGDHGLSMVA